ncbi:sugar phosphate isomerase/epimerase family protein [Bacteroidota bacterium]
MSKNQQSRRTFINNLTIATGGVCLIPTLVSSSCTAAALPGDKMKLGLVTYNWGKDWDIPTIIKNCTESGVLGVELRVEHAHGVGLGISEAEMADVKKMFDDSPIEVVGMGTNEEFDNPDPDILMGRIENAKEFVRISAGIGGSGVKVKPNGFHEGVPHEKTLEQIGKSLNTLGEYAADFGQMIRLEVHGSGTQELPAIKEIMDHVTSTNVGACWNCNDQDLNGEGLEYNFNLVKDRFADIVHIRELNIGEYPYQDLMNLFVGMDYEGWILLECREKPDDTVLAMVEQKKIFQEMKENAREL